MIVQEKSYFDITCHKREYINKSAHLLHWHERYEICQVLKNSCRFIVDGEEIQASEGDIVTINENVVHQFIIDHDDTVIRIIQLPIKLLTTVKNAPVSLAVHIKAEEIKEEPDLEENLNILLNMMDEERGVRDISKNPFLQGLAVAVYFLLERHFALSAPTDSKERNRREFYKIVEYVNAHYKEDITQESVAKALFISRGHLSTIFRKYAFESMSDYVNKLRVKNANLLLSQGKSATEAAHESGFQSVRTFNNVYKAVMGMTPMKYARKN